MIKKVGETLSNELYHYGVKGMKWGTRKLSITPHTTIARTAGKVISKQLPYVTVSEGMRNAKNAAKQARIDTKKQLKESTKKPNLFKRKKIIKDAEKQARNDSFAKDKQSNKEWRDSKNQTDASVRKLSKKNIAVIATTATVAVGSSVVLSLVQNKFEKNLKESFAKKPISSLSNKELYNMGLARVK